MNTEFCVNTVLIIVGVALVSFVMWVGLEDAGDATRKGVMSAIAAAGCILMLIALRKALLALFLQQ